jgi:6-phosphofructokinase 1
VTIQRTGSYAVDYQLAPLAEIAAKTRTMPDEFIKNEGNDVTEAFLSYVQPLLGTGLQSPHRLRAPRVAKIFKKEV